MRYLLYMIIAVLMGSLTSCGGFRQMVNQQDRVVVRVSPEKMTVEQDTVEVMVNVVIPEKYLRKRAHLIVHPELRSESDTLPLKKMVILGEDSDYQHEGDAQQRRIRYENGGNVRMEYRLPYNENLASTELTVYMDLSLDRRIDRFDRSAEIRRIDKLATGTNRIHTFTENELHSFESLDTEADTKHESFKIFFPISSSAIIHQEREGEQIKAFYRFLRTDGFNPESVHIQAFSSPDGPYEFNQMLSKERATHVKGFLQFEMKRFESIDYDENWFSMDQTDEDWIGFREKVDDLELENRERILELLENLTETYEKLETAKAENDRENINKAREILSQIEN